MVLPRELATAALRALVPGPLAGLLLLALLSLLQFARERPVGPVRHRLAFVPAGEDLNVGPATLARTKTLVAPPAGPGFLLCAVCPATTAFPSTCFSPSPCLSAAASPPPCTATTSCPPASALSSMSARPPISNATSSEKSE